MQRRHLAESSMYKRVTDQLLLMPRPKALPRNSGRRRNGNPLRAVKIKHHEVLDLMQLP
jgi:hypothetical protein